MMAVVFFKELALPESRVTGLCTTRDGRLPLKELAVRCDADATSIVIVGGDDEPLRVDESRTTLATWEQLKGEFNLVGTRDQPIPFRVPWKDPGFCKETFCQENGLLRDHAAAFAFEYSCNKAPRRINPAGDLLSQAAAFWSNDIPNEMYNNRVFLASRRTADELKDAVEEVVSKARRQRLAPEDIAFGAAVAVHDGQIVPLVIFPTDGTTMATVLKGEVLTLEEDGFKELAFQVFVAVRRKLSETYLSFEPREKDPLVLQKDNWSMKFRISRLEYAFTHSAYRGGSYLIQDEDGSKLVLKTGPSPSAIVQAKAVGLYGPDWMQIDTELAAREHLQAQKATVGINIPRLLHTGYTVGPGVYSGRQAIVTSFEGDCLAQKVLPMHEVEEMGWSLVTTVANLHQCGLVHGDISPRNVAYNADVDKFCLLDLGAASWGNHFWELTNSIMDLEFGPMHAVLDGSRIPQESCDFESVLFTMVVVAGLELPWFKPAKDLDMEAVRRIRRKTMEEGLLASYAETTFPPLFHALERILLGRSEMVGSVLHELGVQKTAPALFQKFEP